MVNSQNELKLYMMRKQYTPKLQFDFIDDPTYDKNVLLVKKQGSIHSNLKFEYR